MKPRTFITAIISILLIFLWWIGALGLAVETIWRLAEIIRGAG